MPPVAEDVARARSLAALTAAAREWPAEQLEAAEQISERLGHYAVSIVDEDGTVPSCHVPECPLEYHAGGPAAVRLASLLAAAQGHRQVEASHVEAGANPQQLLLAHRRYVKALSDAAAVVYCCRRVLHTNDQCFFDAAGPTSGLCGRVLAVSHQLELDPLAAS